MQKKLIFTPAEARHALVGPPHLWKMKRDFQIEFLKKLGLQGEHYLLDLGCGTLRGGVPIISHLQTGHYYGVDVREEVLKEAGKELREEGLVDKKPVLIHTRDLSLLNIDRKFDLIWAFSVLIHLSDSILNDALHFVSNHLHPAGHFYANVNIGDRKDGAWREFPLVWRSIEFYKDMGRQNGLEVHDMGTIASLGFAHGHQGHDSKQILQFRR
jgi:cyclopropane fatty-acyl-phospholipid synthase-like methyltransferase